MNGILDWSIILFLSFLMLPWLQQILEDIMFDNLAIYKIALDLFQEYDGYYVSDVPGVYWYINEITYTVRVKSSLAVRSAILSDLHGIDGEICDERVQMDVYDGSVTDVYFLYCSALVFKLMERKIRRTYIRKGYHLYSKMNSIDVRKIS